MKREFLQNFKVGDQPLPDEVINAILAEHGKGIEREKAKYSDYETIKEQLKTAKETIEGYKSQDIDGIKKSAKDWEDNAVGSYHSNDYQIKTEPAQSPSTSKPEVKEEVSVLDQFKDKASISNWATASVEKAVKKGVLKSTDKGTLEPALPVTREQLAVILDRLGLLG